MVILPLIIKGQSIANIPEGRGAGGGSFLNDVHLHRAGRLVERRIKRLADIL